MKIKVGFEISHAAAQPTPMVIMLSIHPSRRHDIIGAETIVAEARCADPDFYRDSFGNICGGGIWWPKAGGVTLPRQRARCRAIPACPMRWRLRRSRCRSINCPTTCWSI